MRIPHPFFATAALFTLIFSASCSKKEESAPPAAAEAPSTASAPAAPAEVLEPSKATAKLSLGSDGELMAYDKKELTVKAGEIVSLTFENHSKTSNLEHNWVLSKPGKENDILQAGVTAGADKGWLEVTPDVIAHTKLLKAGEKETIVFRAPPAGQYPYLCTFPGHGIQMRGILKSK